MLSRVATFAIDGIDPRPVWVEVDVRPGLPTFRVVGMAGKAVRESRDRVRAAILNSGFEFPARRITANLAPASLPKVGPGFDAGLAVGLLAASGQCPAEGLERWAVFGELSLGGELRPCRGVLSAAEGARRSGLRGLIVPRERAREAALVEGIEVAAVASLRDVAEVLEGGTVPELPPAEKALPDSPDTEIDLADVRGHVLPLRALEIAAAGGHNLLMEGPPGSGKTMLARRLPSLLPSLSLDEALEVTRIHSAAGVQRHPGLARTRPFRAPHHTISASGLVGGGQVPMPGEASLAHHGVLFLDELSEFSRPSLEALRQPLEDGHATIVRGQRALLFPTRFMLVAATNPCPCGYAGSERPCSCSDAELARHRRRLSGPLLDRLDLLMTVSRPSAEQLRAPAHSSSAVVRERVLAARERQARRLRDSAASCNGQLDARLVRSHVRADEAAQRALGRAYDAGALSARGHDRVLRVACTIADLDGRDGVGVDDVMQSLALRLRVADSWEVAA
ncbi:YifB family Mg chelatase-like AAA ATPase [Conexibacter sp. JD483]|uniref:YifB family Mg chelatase-like AAA ATPase n=1 Tax=unclassified Conexibacter TaxID=2627773 RepID=UPI0027160F42|nr:MULTISPECIES: YifB family Mg chelatase-like AAA ATPase [unclassified Conexibacter]MDO8184519.1 YifB family Mg chelatase-like AAA ATPase [Conexibacter sp. CPCC 205706]MDO8197825.1 YifB family Mg chelatase-like AAA ATPase [Conexibacter sp. CPCC 205762]MDR9369231.1 YifB family Mg chelatase-like AAA ATPase [Conexibacter sp. JD483]